jgi:hypothetical protein
LADAYQENDKPLPKTLLEAIRYFSDPDNCLNFMAELRWPDGKKIRNCHDAKLKELRGKIPWSYARRSLSYFSP